MGAAPAPWKHGVPWWLQSRAARSLAAIETLLPTPVSSQRDRTQVEAELAHLPGREMGRGGGAAPDLSAVVVLLPAPETGQTPDGHGIRGGTPGSGQQSGRSLDQVVQLLPTPQSRDLKGPPGTAARRNGGFQASLPASIRDLRGGDGTGPQSRGGKGYSDEPLPLQWNQDDPGSA